MEKLLAHAAGAVSRAGHGSMMVEGELMSFHKPMSPWSGQELTSYNKQDSRLPLPVPDPYGSEPPRQDHKHLITRTDCPFTAEPNNVQLVQAGVITPNELFYIRDHLPAPDLSAGDYSLTIEGPGVDAEGFKGRLQQQQQHKGSADDNNSAVIQAATHTSSSRSSSSRKSGKVTLSLQDLQEGFEHHSILATLQCAGNRRNDMRRLKEVKGGPWEAGAIGTALWTGPWLRDVLAAAGVDVRGLAAAEQQRQHLQQVQWAQAAMRQLQLQQQQKEGRGGAAAVVHSAAELAARAGAGAAAAGLEAAERAVAGAAAAPAGDDTATAAATAAAAPNIRHVWFEGYDNAGPDTHFLVSVPLLDALSEDSDVLLAVQMNGDVLPSYHGYPVRVVVPGHVGVRSCKWLKRIVLAADEAPSHWQQSDYKMLPPGMDSQLKADWGAVPAMQLLPVQSAMCVPAAGDVCEVGVLDGCIDVEGYAWSGGGVGVIRVEVTADGGNSWTTAELRGMEELGRNLQEGVGVGNAGKDSAQVAESVSGRHGYSGRAWAWTLWRARVPVSPGVVKAAVSSVVGGIDGSVSCSGDGAQQQRQQQEEMQGMVEQKQDKQQQEQQGGAAVGRSAVAVPESSDNKVSGTVDGVPEGRRLVRLKVKATDARYSTQPSDVGSIWNIRGVGNNAWHSVEVFV